MPGVAYGSKDIENMEGLAEFVSKSFVKEKVPSLQKSLASLPCKVEGEFEESSSEPTDLRVRRRSESPEARPLDSDIPQRLTPPPKTETGECPADSDNGRSLVILSLFIPGLFNILRTEDRYLLGALKAHETKNFQKIIFIQRITLSNRPGTTRYGTFSSWVLRVLFLTEGI